MDKGISGFPSPQELLPHRFPFIFIDKVVSLDRGRKLVAVREVREDEFWVQGHFPTEPVMPGVLIVESIAQACALLALISFPEYRGYPFFLAKIKEARFKRLVRPGEAMQVEAKLVGRKSNFWFMEGKASVDGEEVAFCEISAFHLPKR